MTSSEFYLFFWYSDIYNHNGHVFITSFITINHHSLKLNSCIITYHKQMIQSPTIQPGAFTKFCSKTDLSFIN